jgi:FkbM family methyltransferase
MHYSLILIGAHDGSKTEGLIRPVIGDHKALLIEPVPFLFNRLRQRYAAIPNVVLRNIAIATTDGEIEFNAPRETANSIIPYGDQLGSVVRGHAVAHDARMSQHMEVIKAQASTFETLVEAEAISSVHTLFTDTEGMDAELLPTFPFSKIVPKQIIFEFKHADGYMRVGRKLASLLMFLDDHGYVVQVLDAENMIARHQSLAR